MAAGASGTSTGGGGALRTVSVEAWLSNSRLATEQPCRPLSKLAQISQPTGVRAIRLGT